MARSSSKGVDKLIERWPYRRVFLTGATGLIGGQLLHDMLMIPQVEEVICLVRQGNGLPPSSVSPSVSNAPASRPKTSTG